MAQLSLLPDSDDSLCPLCRCYGTRHGKTYRCSSCGQEWVVRVSASVKAEPPVTLRQARRLLGRDTVNLVLEHGRHHHDERGRPWWTHEDLSEATELVEIEHPREEAV